MDNLCFNCFFKYYHICMILFNLLIIHAYHVFADPSVKNDEPGFHSLLKSDITVAATEPAYLHCKVENQGLYQCMHLMRILFRLPGFALQTDKYSALTMCL
ncbi:conserved hypothetical protein [Trichinella spiralis]|uniref:hypothetical protein n=1 Tax=Trichinella spiralis TaxID=6334 RepID=UPI0001EFE13A|nr:conserved hypothetical protein [Trichinella spiralis]